MEVMPRRRAVCSHKRRSGGFVEQPDAPIGVPVPKVSDGLVRAR